VWCAWGAFAGASTSNYRLPGLGLLWKARASRDTRAGNWGRLRSRSRRLVQAVVDSPPSSLRLQTWHAGPGCTLTGCSGLQRSQASLAATDDRPSMRPRPSSSLAFGLLLLPASGPGMAFATWDSPGRPGRDALLEYWGESPSLSSALS